MLPELIAPKVVQDIYFGREVIPINSDKNAAEIMETLFKKSTSNYRIMILSESSFQILYSEWYFSNIMQTRFVGVLENSSGKCIVGGRFRHSLTAQVATALLVAIIFIEMCFSVGLIGAFVSVYVSLQFIRIPLKLFNIFNSKDEEELVNLIQSVASIH